MIVSGTRVMKHARAVFTDKEKARTKRYAPDLKEEIPRHIPCAKNHGWGDPTLVLTVRQPKSSWAKANHLAGGYTARVAAIGGTRVARRVGASAANWPSTSNSTSPTGR